MKDPTAEEIREWKQSPVTLFMIDELRKLSELAKTSAVQSAQTSARLQEISVNAGVVTGVEAAINHLTRKQK